MNATKNKLVYTEMLLMSQESLLLAYTLELDKYYKASKLVKENAITCFLISKAMLNTN